jgi:hypothetical protein
MLRGAAIRNVSCFTAENTLYSGLINDDHAEIPNVLEVVSAFGCDHLYTLCFVDVQL